MTWNHLTAYILFGWDRNTWYQITRLKNSSGTIGDARGVVTNVLECDIVESEFDIQSCYYVYFWTFTFGKDMKLFNTVPMG